jgi:Zn-dependent protease with chaperone function
MLAGSGCVFLAAPVMIRHIWDTAPLPAGELRQRLTDLCRMHRVGVRELLLWRTYGGMINAAVMGMIAPLRYILLTDGLLEMVPARQIEAVMAHEVAHVRRRHLFWLLVVAVGALIGFAAVWEQGLKLAVVLMRSVGPLRLRWIVGEVWQHPWVLEVVAGAGMLACWGLIFGWVSRRFERQADTFAVQHFAAERAVHAGAAVESAVIAAQDVQAMTAALQHVADLNHIPTARRSWRHGSILWRQDYLRTLTGQRLNDLAIDRQVKWIKLTAAIGGVVALSAAALSEGGGF